MRTRHGTKAKPVRVSEVLRRYLARSGLAARLEQASVIEAWSSLVGAEIARVAVPERVTPDGTLFVRVKSSAWRQELSLMTPEIMRQVNRGRKKGRIGAIRWIMGDRRADGPTDRRSDAATHRRGEDEPQGRGAKGPGAGESAAPATPNPEPRRHG